jgi:hypothetical protein
MVADPSVLDRTWDSLSSEQNREERDGEMDEWQLRNELMLMPAMPICSINEIITMMSSHPQDALTLARAKYRKATQMI